MKTIELPCYGITVELVDDDNPNLNTSGRASSNLKTTEPGESSPDPDFIVAVDTLESFILAQACAGIDIESPQYLAAIETTVSVIFNEYT